jgi:hypothetical protein
MPACLQSTALNPSSALNHPPWGTNGLQHDSIDTHVVT